MTPRAAVSSAPVQPRISGRVPNRNLSRKSASEVSRAHKRVIANGKAKLKRKSIPVPAGALSHLAKEGSLREALLRPAMTAHCRTPHAAAASHASLAVHAGHDTPFFTRYGATYTGVPGETITVVLGA